MTSDINSLELWRAGAILEKKLLSIGAAKLRLGKDIDEFENILDATAKSEIGEHFRQSITTLPPSRLLWLAAFDDGGNVIGTIATRYDDIEGWTLQRYIKAYWERAFETGDQQQVKLAPNSSPFASEIIGPLVYMGEGYVAEGWRHKGVSSCLVRMLTLLSWQEWKPNIIYGWMRPKHVMRGMHMKWGFTEAYEAGLDFIDPPKQQDYRDLYFVSCRKAAICQMVFSMLREDCQAASNTHIETSDQTS